MGARKMFLLMFWVFIFLLNRSYGFNFPGDYRELCYKVLGSDKNLQIWTHKNFNFDFDGFVVKINLQENTIKKLGPEVLTETLYLQLNHEKCEYSELQFSRKTKKKDFWSVFKILFYTNSSLGQVFEELGLDLYPNHIMSQVILQGTKKRLAVPVTITKQQTSLQTSYRPGIEKNVVPPLRGNQFYCLKLLTYGTGYVDKFLPAPLQSNFEKYVFLSIVNKLKGGKDWFYGTSVHDWGEISVCENIPLKPFPIMLQVSKMSQRVYIQIQSGDNKLETAFQLYPSGKAKTLNEETTWIPNALFIEAVPAATAKAQNFMNGIALFPIDPKESDCIISQGKGHYKEYIDDDLIMEEKNYIVAFTAQNSGIQIKREMTDEELAECKKHPNNS